MSGSLIPFVKYEGAGNDFVLVRRRDLDPSLDLAALAVSLCHRRKGIGADGLLVLDQSQIADYRMRIFNADGSEPTMCGNGAYCLLDYVDKQIAPFEKVTLETAHTILKARKQDGRVILNLGRVSCRHFPMDLEENPPCYVIHTGVPHAVVWTCCLHEIDVDRQGRLLRYDSRFAPEGVNVNFAELGSDGLIQLRTYERGVEGETLACGTGAAAAAFVAKQLYALPNPIQVATRTDFRSLHYSPSLQFIFSQEEIEMIGSAAPLFEGVWQPSVRIWY